MHACMRLAKAEAEQLEKTAPKWRHELTDLMCPKHELFQNNVLTHPERDAFSQECKALHAKVGRIATTAQARLNEDMTDESSKWNETASDTNRLLVNTQTLNVISGASVLIECGATQDGKTTARAWLNNAGFEVPSTMRQKLPELVAKVEAQEEVAAGEPDT